jgi:hypothetical protein
MMKASFGIDRDGEVVLFCSLAFLMVSALAMMSFSPSAYRGFVAEDGAAEWIATLALFSCAVISLGRSVKSNGKSRWFHVLVALVFLFAVGEELSWGQRLFGVESSPFFEDHNWQGETNVHNLYFGSFHVNKVIFGTVMGAFLSFYLVGLPLLFGRDSVRAFVDMLGIPVPRVRHTVLIVLFSLVVSLISGPDKWELMELCGSMMFLSIFMNPLNASCITAQPVEERTRHDADTHTAGRLR